MLLTNLDSGLILQETSGDGPKVTLLTAVSNSENSKEWTLGLSGQGSIELAIAFDGPTGVQVTELHWPKLRPFSLERMPRPTQTAPQPPSFGGQIVGTIEAGGANVLVLLIQVVDEKVVIEIKDDTPQAITDETGQFEFVGVPPGRYVIVSHDKECELVHPNGQDEESCFRLFDPPSNPSNPDLITIIPVRNFSSLVMWDLRVDEEQTIDLGSISW